MRRSLVVLLPAMIAGLVLTLAFSPPLSAYSPLWQASKTPSPGPAAPLSLNKIITGTLNTAGETITYSFEIPADQDIVLAVEADKLVLPGYCVQLAAPAAGLQDCHQEGGGGGDGPVAFTFVLPASSVPDARQTVELTLTRALDGLASYQVTAYSMTPQSLVLGQSTSITPDAAQPYQLYALDTEPEDTFAIEIEEDRADGAYLWVAAYPPFLGESVTLSEERQLLAQDLDYAFNEDDADGLSLLELYYLGGSSYRVLVGATSDYLLQPTAVPLRPLAEQTEQTVTVAYDVPIQLFHLDTDQGDTAEIHFEVTDGTGALAAVYPGDSLFSDSLALGTSSSFGPFPLSGTIEHAVNSNSDLVVVVQIPYEFDRSPVTVNVDWERKQAQ